MADMPTPERPQPLPGPDFGVARTVLPGAGPAGRRGTPSFDPSPHGHEPGGHLGRNVALLGGVVLTAAGVAGGLTIADRMGGDDNTKPAAGTNIDIPAGFGQANPNIIDNRTGQPFGATETKTPTPEAKKEAPFPYKLAEGSQVEYKGRQVTVKFGVEEALANRPADHTTSVNGKELKSPPIKKVELSNADILKYATDKFPNGMSQDEMVQRLNDAVLQGMLPFVNNMPEYANSKLDLEGLKEVIDQGKEVKFNHPLVEGGQPIDLSKGVSIIFIDQRDDKSIANAPGTTSYVYKEHNGQIEIGIWSAYSDNIGVTTQPEFRAGYEVSVSVARALAADLTGLEKNTVAINDILIPYFGTSKINGWTPVTGIIKILE